MGKSSDRTTCKDGAEKFEGKTTVKNPPRFDPRVEPVVGVFRRKGGDGDVRVAREDDERDQESPRERMHG